MRVVVAGVTPGLAQITAVRPKAAHGTGHHVTEGTSKGRIARRAIWIAPATGVEFPGAEQVFRIRRDALAHKGNRPSKEVVRRVTGLAAIQAGPEAIAEFVRQHWESKCDMRSHWLSEVTGKGGSIIDG